MDANIAALLQSNLQWLFVGGKGGVGKTTTSCAIATLFASTLVPDGKGGMRRRKVLLVSTDPAHNLSDAFSQQLGKTPMPIRGLESTLYAMELDRSQLLSGASSFSMRNEGNTQAEVDGGNGTSLLSAVASIVKEAAGSLPGVDELAVFTEILHASQSADFDIVVFDTAPTGHTLQLLATPHVFDTFMDKLTKLDGVMPLLESASQVLQSMQSSSDTSHTVSDTLSPQGIHNLLSVWHTRVRSIRQQFTDHTKTAFVCVCIPEFLSLYETERLIQELMKSNIFCDTIIVNQIVSRPAADTPCRMCTARQRMQARYLHQIDALYDEFHVVKMPLLTDEVRGLRALQLFGRFLVDPYDVERHGYVEVELPC